MSADRALAWIAQAHEAYTTGKTTHAQYVAAVAGALALWKGQP